MRKIVDYKNVKGVNLDELDKIVAEELKSHWQPFNSIFVNNSIGSISMVTTYIQTLVRYEE